MRVLLLGETLLPVFFFKKKKCSFNKAEQRKSRMIKKTAIIFPKPRDGCDGDELWSNPTKTKFKTTSLLEKGNTRNKH